MNQGLASAFPRPPAFSSLFTDENIDQVKKATDNDDIENLPKELHALIPPNIPTEGTYRSFGEVWHVKDILPSLQEAGITQLFDSEPGVEIDRAQELHRLVQSLLLNYLELVTILSIGPESFPEKVEHIRIILINIHHLINEYRPHQAKETLISMMKAQIERDELEIKETEDACILVKNAISSASSALLASPPQNIAIMNDQDNDAKQKDLKIWEAIIKEVDIGL